MAFARVPGWPFAGFFAVTPSILGGMILSLRPELVSPYTVNQV